MRQEPVGAPPTRTFVALLLSIATAHALLYLLRFDEAALFNVDVERDLTRAWDWMVGGAFPFAGPNISDTQYTLGSMFYLLLAIPMSLGPDPLMVRGFFVLCASLALVVMGFTLRRFTRGGVALLAVAALGATNFWYENLRQLWHSNLLPLVVAAAFAGYASFTTSFRLRSWLVAVAASALAVQLHATMVVFPVALLVAAVVYRRELGWKGIAASAVVAAVTLAPFIAGLVMVEATETRELDRWLGYASGGSVVDAIGYLVWSLIPGLGTPSARGWFASPVAIIGILALVLVGAGIVAAIRSKRRGRLDFPRFLVLVSLGGFAVQLVVFKHESSTRYLHANAYAVLALAAIGADQLTSRLPRLAKTGAALGVAVALIAVAAFRSPIPGEPGAAFCSLVAQRAAATAIVDGYGIPAVDVERRVHGLACRHRSSGYHWFYRARPQSVEAAAVAREKDVHVFMMPADLPLRPAAAEVFGEQIIGPPHRALRLTAYRPIIDYHRLHVVISRERAERTALPEAGRRAPGAGDGAIRQTVTFPYGPNANRLHLRFWQGSGPDCRVVVAGAPNVTAEKVEAGSRGGQRLYELAVGDAAGQLQIELGPCGDIDAVEVF